MNINQNINKLLYGLKQKGQIYRINSFQFYNEDKEKYSTKYQVLKKKLVETYNPKTEKLEPKEKYEQDYECYSKINLMHYFMEEYKGMG